MKIYLSNTARVHAKLGIFYVRHAKQKTAYVRKFLFSLAAYHFSIAYFLYFRKGNQIITSKIYEALMQAKCGKLDPALFGKIFDHGPLSRTDSEFDPKVAISRHRCFEFIKCRFQENNRRKLLAGRTGDCSDLFFGLFCLHPPRS